MVCSMVILVYIQFNSSVKIPLCLLPGLCSTSVLFTVEGMQQLHCCKHKLQTHVATSLHYNNCLLIYKVL